MLVKSKKKQLICYGRGKPGHIKSKCLSKHKKEVPRQFSRQKNSTMCAIEDEEIEHAAQVVKSLDNSQICLGFRSYSTYG